VALTVERARALADEASDLIGGEVDVRENYSGRGMYGRETIAFTFDDFRAVLALGFAAGVAFERAEGRGEDADFDFDDLPSAMDSMGRGRVIY
jgi:hypothetical protein